MNIELDSNILSEIVIKTHFTNLDFWNQRDLLESAIAEIVFDSLFNFKNESTELIPQRTIKTISGNFRPDIILKIGQKEISIECDGNEKYPEYKTD